MDALPDPPWREKRASPRVRLSSDAIVQAALKVLDRDGLKNISMRTVAAELEARPGSLYWHVRSKEELLDLLFDAVIGENFARLDDIEQTGREHPSEWAEQFFEVGLRWREMLLHHPDLCLVTLGRIPTGPNYLRAREWLLAFLRRADVPIDIIAVIVDTVQLYITSFVATETQLQHMGGQSMRRETAEQLLRQYYQELPADRFSNLRELADVITGDSEIRFTIGLRALLQGFSDLSRAGDNNNIAMPTTAPSAEPAPGCQPLTN